MGIASQALSTLSLAKRTLKLACVVASATLSAQCDPY